MKNFDCEWRPTEDEIDPFGTRTSILEKVLLVCVKSWKSTAMALSPKTESV